MVGNGNLVVASASHNYILKWQFSCMSLHRDCMGKRQEKVPGNVGWEKWG